MIVVLTEDEQAELCRLVAKELSDDYGPHVRRHAENMGDLESFEYHRNRTAVLLEKLGGVE